MASSSNQFPLIVIVGYLPIQLVFTGGMKSLFPQLENSKTSAKRLL
jgi:hypothetical protein